MNKHRLPEPLAKLGVVENLRLELLAWWPELQEDFLGTGGLVKASIQARVLPEILLLLSTRRDVYRAYAPEAVKHCFPELWDHHLHLVKTFGAGNGRVEVIDPTAHAIADAMARLRPLSP